MAIRIKVGIETTIHMPEKQQVNHDKRNCSAFDWHGGHINCVDRATWFKIKGRVCHV